MNSNKTPRRPRPCAPQRAPSKPASKWTLSLAIRTVIYLCVVTVLVVVVPEIRHSLGWLLSALGMVVAAICGVLVALFIFFG